MREQRRISINFYKGEQAIRLEFMPGNVRDIYRFTAVDERGQWNCKVLLGHAGAEKVVWLFNHGWDVINLPRVLIDAMLEDAQYSPYNQLFAAYEHMHIDADDWHGDDDETYYGVPPCDCEAPLIEASCACLGDDYNGPYAYRMTMLFPTQRQCVSMDGDIVRVYRRGPTICPDKELDYDDLRLICSFCGASR